MEKAAYSVAYSQIIQKFYTDNAQEHRLLNYVSDVRSVFSNTFVFNQYLIGISLYDSQGNYLISTGSTLLKTNPLASGYIGISHCVYSGAQQHTDSNISQFILVYPIYKMNQPNALLENKIGFVVFTLNAEFLESLFMQSEYYDNTNIFIADADKHLMISNSGISLSADQATQISKDNIHYSTVIKNTQWELHSVMPSSSISNDMRPMILLVYGTSGLYVILLFWMLYFFRSSIFAPISKLSRFMQHMPDAQGKMRLEINSSNEFGMMMRIMNDMLDALDAKSQQIIDNETRILKGETARQQMEIIAYRNQINPHFLYNTLDCIRGIAFMHHANEIVEICQSLSKMFRYAVSGGDTATVKEEIEYVGFYATIIGYRFSNRISITTDASDDVLECKTIKMLLQPLVENSVLHGLEQKIGPGNIYIRIRATQAHLNIEVKDDGCGIAKEKLDSFNNKILEAQSIVNAPSTTQSSIGILNIARRLYLFYGADESFVITSDGLTGTIVRITMPICKEP